MGWSTELFCNISFHKQTYNSKYEVEAEIENLKECIKTAENRIRNLVMITEPNKFVPEECDPISYLTDEFEEQLELIREYEIELYKHELLLYNWDACHNEEGLAISPPKDMKWDTAYLEGDFVKSVDSPGDNLLE